MLGVIITRSSSSTKRCFHTPSPRRWVSSLPKRCPLSRGRSPGSACAEHLAPAKSEIDGAAEELDGVDEPQLVHERLRDLADERTHLAVRTALGRASRS